MNKKSLILALIGLVLIGAGITTLILENVIKKNTFSYECLGKAQKAPGFTVTGYYNFTFRDTSLMKSHLISIFTFESLQSFENANFTNTFSIEKPDKTIKNEKDLTYTFYWEHHNNQKKSDIKTLKEYLENDKNNQKYIEYIESKDDVRMQKYIEYIESLGYTCYLKN